MKPSITLTEDTNCSSLIAKLILDYFEVPEAEQSLHLLHGMGHGVELGSICGGLSGAIFAMNHLLAKQGASEAEIKDAHNSFRSAFMEKYSVVNCSDLLALHFDSTEFESRQTRFCGHLLDDSTNEAIEIINLVTSIINPISSSMNQH